MKNSIDTIQDWFAKINDEALEKLTKWEADFIASIEEQFDKKGWLSDRQEEILERIYAQYTN